MQRIRRNCDTWILKSLWEEDPHHWQTDLFFTEEEAVNFFMSAMSSALAVKYFIPNGDMTMDYFITREEASDGTSKQVRTASLMPDGRRKSWERAVNFGDSEEDWLRPGSLTPGGHAEDGAGEEVLGPNSFFEISEPVRDAEDDHEPKNATGDTDHG